MAYTPENNPYIPGDPYSYDLKWMVQRIKTVINDLQTAVTDIEAAADLAGQALTKATQAGNTADVANSVAGQAYELAGQAMEAAQQAAGAVEILDVTYDWVDDHVAAIDTEYTWDELCAKVKAGTVMFRCFPEDDLPQPIYFGAPVRAALTVANKNTPDNFLNANIQITEIRAGIASGAWEDGVPFFVTKLWFMNYLDQGTAYRRSIDTSVIPL